MKIAVIGCSGKVNSLVIEEIIKSEHNELVGVLMRLMPSNNDYYKFPLYDDIGKLAEKADAIIDFTNPQTSLEIAKKLMHSNTLLVCGTTGFSEREFNQFQTYAKFFPIIWSANMSIGINLLLSILPKVTKKLGADFDCGIIDIHRKHKKDFPSGTALLLANEIEKGQGNYPEISSLRIGEEKGEHLIIFSSENESLTINHKTLNRSAYVRGAIHACAWGKDKKPGFYNMLDVFA